MKNLLFFGLTVVCILLAVGAAAQTQKIGGVGIRAGAGTDINLGLAYGAEVNYAKYLGRDAFEIGLDFFQGHSEEVDDSGIHSYTDKTDVTVFAALVDYLFLYSLDQPGPYFVIGFGFGAVSVEWEESSPTDVSLGTLLPGGGSKQSADGSAGGSIINFGIGHRFTEQLDIRAQLPTFFIFSTPGEASSIVPTLTLTVGYRF
jgi:hypothetical protein